MDATIEQGVSMALRLSAPLDEPVARAMSGGLFPLTRGEVLLLARENEAAPYLLTVLAGIPDSLYANLKEVQEAVVAS